MKRERERKLDKIVQVEVDSLLLRVCRTREGLVVGMEKGAIGRMKYTNSH